MVGSVCNQEQTIECKEVCEEHELGEHIKLLRALYHQFDHAKFPYASSRNF